MFAAFRYRCDWQWQTCHQRIGSESLVLSWVMSLRTWTTTSARNPHICESISVPQICSHISSSNLKYVRGHQSDRSQIVDVSNGLSGWRFWRSSSGIFFSTFKSSEVKGTVMSKDSKTFSSTLMFLILSKNCWAYFMIRGVSCTKNSSLPCSSLAKLHVRDPVKEKDVISGKPRSSTVGNS